MAESSAAGPGDWSRFAEEMNRTLLDAVEQNVAAQARFVEAWYDAVDESWTTSADTVADGAEGYGAAYEAWMRAAEEQLDRTGDLLAGEDVSPNDFRDVWLNTANEAFKEVMSTSAFAAATGETVSDALAVKQQVDETAEETLHGLGFPTESDVAEVGARLVELERRQHDVEEKLDRILEELSDEDGP
jgi:methyl-accepting chemotaxis protein